MSLIESRKHTKADLAAWEKWLRYDRVQAESVHLDVRVNQALDVISSFAEGGDCLVGTSWGKDSVVLCHLVYVLDLDVPVVRMCRDERRPDRMENPDVPAVRDAFLERFPLHRYEEFFSDADDALADMNRAYGDGRYISGVRADESAARVLTIRRNGLWGESTARPLGYWTARDIWAYSYRYDLPIHPAYAMTFGGTFDRDRIRVHSFGDTQRGSGFGRLQWEEHYYKEVWHELRRRTLESA